ncbi:MAG: RcpC/CpaB family pilus assembly protein [Oscillospiraceae bacterium]|nr:RcpC/CpaB family pilus assembly protein [Oscillospiraceae bacterium]
MKNRTVIGIICMLLAVAVTFGVAPVVNRMMGDTTTVIRLSADIRQGAQITSEQIETVEVKTDTLPAGVITQKTEVIGKYAVSALYSGDYFTAPKLTDQANTANDVFASLDGSKVAVSITIDTFAAGLSGKLQNGDIISMIVINKDSGNAVIPAELKYIKVITTTTAGGIDKDSVTTNEDGSYDLPSTVTVLVSTEQAKLLAKYEESSTMQTALVYRGDSKTAHQFLDKQEEYLKTAGGAANE